MWCVATRRRHMLMRWCHVALQMKMGTDDDWLTAQTGDMDDYGDYDDFI